MVEALVAAPKGKRQRTDQARKFRWTINDYNWEADPIGDKLLSLPLDKKIRCLFSFVVWSHEKGDEKQRDHLQGYMRLVNTGSYGTVQALLGYKAHVAIADMSEQCNIDYCSKDRTHIAGPWTFGVPMKDGEGQGARQDLKALAASVQAGTFDPLQDDASGALFIKHHSGIKQLQTMMALKKPKIRTVQTTTFWGPTEIGKSTWFWDAMAEKNQLGDAYKLKYPQSKSHAFFWPGYTGQHFLLLDEFADDRLSPQVLNEILDGLPMMVRTSTDSFVYAQWEHVLITVNEPPETWYFGEHQSVRDAVMRRVRDGLIHVPDRDSLKALWEGSKDHIRWGGASAVDASRGPAIAEDGTAALSPPVGAFSPDLADLQSQK
nr:MAG: replication associated protein [Arizlama virus]